MGVVRQLVFLCGTVLLLWGLAAVAARIAWGDLAILQSGTAALLCLLPAAVTLVWAHQAGQSVQARLLTILGGTGIRLAVVLAGGFGLNLLLPELFPWPFWIWLMVFYIFTLGVETVLLVRGPGHRSRRSAGE